jgi:hypothetical protein
MTGEEIRIIGDRNRNSLESLAVLSRISSFAIASLG